MAQMQTSILSPPIAAMEHRFSWPALEVTLTLFDVLSRLELISTFADFAGETPLHRACYNGHLDVVRVLLEAGADLHATDNGGRTPLHRACDNGHLDVVRVLFEAGADLHATDDGGRTPLHLACDNGHFDVVRVLFEAGADLHATDNCGRTPLHHACDDGQFDVVRFLLDAGALADLNAARQFWWTLHFIWLVGGFAGEGVGQRNFDVVKMLLDEGAHLEARNSNGFTPLLEASNNGQVEIMQELIDRDADMFATAADSQTAFDLAHGAHAENCLIEAYAAKLFEREGPQAIHSILQAATYSFRHATAYGPPQQWLVQLPLGKLTVDQFLTLLRLLPGDGIRRRDNNEALPLHVACRRGAPVEILRPLLQLYPAALQRTDAIGDLPLHAACRSAEPSLKEIRFLVELDLPAVRMPNIVGALPLHLLCGSRPPAEVVQYLVRSFEGSLSIRTPSGDLPFMVACKTSASESVLQVLLTTYPDALVYMQEYYSSHAPGTRRKRRRLH